MAAALDILATDGPEGLTVHRIVDEASSSIGSFYARFDGKDDLLDYLGRRIWDEALERWNDSLESTEWSALELAEMVDGAVGLLYDVQHSRSRHLRALDRAVDGPDDAYRRFRRHLVSGLEELFLQRSDEMSHPDPRLAVSVSLRAVLGVLDAAEDLPLDEPSDPAASTRGREDVVVRECRNLLTSYLTGQTSGPEAGENVDFFDVWG